MHDASGPISPDDLIAYLDGDLTPDRAKRIADDPHWSAQAREYAETQAALQGRLYRFSCPAPQTLGEYELGMLTAADRTRIAQHVIACPHCTAELGTFRTFMATEVDAPPIGAVERVRRFVATLVPQPRGAVAGLRGAGDETTRAYHANGVTITVDIGPVRRGRTSLIGLIVRDDGGAVPAGNIATLVGVSGAVVTAEIDDLGNFAFDEVRTGTWQVEVGIGDDIIAIEEIRIGT
jgi:hypothetical protein